LRPYCLEDGVYEIGFHLRPDYWGKGLGTEAAKAVIDYAFTTLKANDLFAEHHPNNIGSMKLLEKLGFHHTHDEFYEPTGLNHPSYRYMQ
jgi:RimJ/RimL family protein N-acetyltransferase